MMGGSAAIDFIIAVSGAIAGPAALGAAGYAWKIYREITRRTDRNTEANWGSNEPYNPWPGTVKLTVDHEERLQQIEDELELEPPEPSNKWQQRFGKRPHPDGGYRGRWHQLKHQIRRAFRRWLW